jgi:uncharacterized protein YggE
MKIADLGVSPDDGPYNNRRESPIAYDFSRSIEIRLTDFTSIEPFLADAFNVGLTHVDQIHFRVSNQRKHQFEARKLAILYAQEKAEHLTSLTGMKLGLPITIEEGVEHNWDAGGFGGAVGVLSTPVRPQKVILATFQEAEPKVKSIDINTPGHIKITAEVTVTFEMASE